ncbi:MAG: thioredoxin family protein [Bacteriovoracaceae bacterium]
MKKTFLTLFFLLHSFLSYAQTDTKNLVKYGLTSFTDNKESYIVLSLKNEDGWHTYWKNPGDAGTPTEVKFYEGKKEISFSPLEWSVPHRYFETGDLLAYGYEGTTHYFFKQDQKVKGPLKVEGKWLVCKDICVPGKGEIDFSLKNNSIVEQKGQTFLPTSDEVQNAYKALPLKIETPKDLQLNLTGDIEKKILTLHYSYNISKAQISLKDNFLTPFPMKPLGFKREELFYQAKSGKVLGKILIDWEGEYQDPEMPLPKSKKFLSPISMRFLLTMKGSTSVIESKFSEFKDDKSMDQAYLGADLVSPTGATQKKTPVLNDANSVTENSQQSLLYFMLFAFLGGLILNLMPCVLPVISLKLYSLLKQQNESDNRILKHNLSYTSGILTCFLLLAAIIISIKKSGEDIGWGFQLQSPTFLILMIVLLFVFCLNLFGLFEFMTPGGRTIGNKEVKGGFIGDFFSGVFATVLSTPCSAPFLGTALTFAFTTSYLNIVLIFMMIGLGLAFPFLITGFFPALAHFLPKPGLWMEHLKKFLGFTLLLTALWLYDVLFANNPPASLLNFVNLTLSLLFFGFYLRKTMPKNKILGLVFIVLAMTTLALSMKISMQVNSKSEVIEVTQGWENFSEEKLNSYNDQVVFIDFTADWCFTCKVNEKLLLNTSRFKEFALKNQMVLMKGDWTKKDDNITQFLKRYNIFGVPAYFVKKKNGEIIFLGELVTLEKIEKHLH